MTKGLCKNHPRFFLYQSCLFSHRRNLKKDTVSYSAICFSNGGATHIPTEAKYSAGKVIKSAFLRFSCSWSLSSFIAIWAQGRQVRRWGYTCQVRPHSSYLGEGPTPPRAQRSSEMQSKLPGLEIFEPLEAWGSKIFKGYWAQLAWPGSSSMPTGRLRGWSSPLTSFMSLAVCTRLVLQSSHQPPGSICCFRPSHYQAP